MDQEVKKYLKNDKIFSEMNKHFISLKNQKVKQKNEHLNEVCEELIETMKNQNLLFKETFKQTIWTESFYKKTKIGSPYEFDLNLIIKLPIKEDNIQFSTNLPGYIKICTHISTNDILNMDILDMDSGAYRDMVSFIDKQTYLDQDQFRRWFESVLKKAVEVINKNKETKRFIRKQKNYTVKIKKSGPAFTLILQIPNEPVSIDLVPVLAFLGSHHPLPCSRNDMPEYCDKNWFLVPKSLKNKNIPNAERNRYWRLSFDEFEKAILTEHGRAKPIIRHLKKFRDTQNLKYITSYYIETLCFYHLDIFKEQRKQRKSSTFLFFTMLQQLYEAFHNRCIKYYWDENLNLLEKIKYDEMKNIENRLLDIIKDIEKQIIENPKDQFAIARYVLNSEEIKLLQD